MEDLEDGFIGGKVKGIHICSCYDPSSGTFIEFGKVLNILFQGMYFVGDFNAWNSTARQRMLEQPLF